MSMNMIEILKGQLGGMVAGQIAKKFGIDPAVLQSGIGALLPTILGGLLKQASTPEGAQSLEKTLDSPEFDGGLLDNIGDMFSTGNAASPEGDAGGLIEGLFGAKAGMIADIVGKVSGMKSGTAGSLMAMLAPIVMSFLGKQKRSLGLDSGGLANLLMSQKDEIAKSLPGGMAGTLGLTDLGFEDTPANVPASTPAAPPKATPPATPSPSGGGLMSKLIPVVILGVLAFVGFKMFNQPAAPTVPDVDADVIDALENIDMGSAPQDTLGLTGADATGKLSEIFSGYTETLQSVDDVESAQTAVPEMQSLNEKLGSMTSMLDQLPASVRSTVTDQIGPMIEPIKAMIDKVLAIPGVGPILQPIVDNMLAKVGTLTSS
ncbi:hypothetical protein FHS27_002201 [Rhodopirellula rubra]|uniref:DUF937 domain-containing protein n=1 Tax=Aporhodopirellula rubra TaxID=980271 RepID=A0A7W5H4H2_9BACT|nr:DUF937 domain-containing protein [Aporhodopirellula rubra]MBB3206392.1 hypothetical protein [Aporhodopirellula rubra]